MLEFNFKMIKRVFIAEEVIFLLNRHRQKTGQVETGGVLAGKILIDNNVLITNAMPPSTKNQAGRTWLLRNKADAQEWIDKVFEESKGHINYLGEWHTHPTNKLNPSKPDQKMLHDLLKTSHLTMDFLVGLIVGIDGNICCWIQNQNDDCEIACNQ